MVLPLLITFYLGGVEVSQGVAVDRKVTLAARSVADLVAQATSVTTSDVNDILNATVSVVAPWPSTNLKVIVSQVKIDAQSNATVQWSEAKNTTARPQNQAVSRADRAQDPEYLADLGRGAVRLHAGDRLCHHRHAAAQGPDLHAAAPVGLCDPHDRLQLRKKRPRREGGVLCAGRFPRLTSVPSA